MSILRLARYAVTAAVAATLAAGSSGCHDTVTGPHLSATPAPAPTATPIPGSIVGNWIGTSAGCGTGPANATFQQAGSTVTGTMSGGSGLCGFETANFNGTISGGDVSGSAVGPDGHATVTGTLSGTTLVLKVRGFDIDAPEIDLNLHR